MAYRILFVYENPARPTQYPFEFTFLSDIPAPREGQTITASMPFRVDDQDANVFCKVNAVVTEVSNDYIMNYVVVHLSDLYEL